MTHTQSTIENKDPQELRELFRKDFPYRYIYLGGRDREKVADFWLKIIEERYISREEARRIVIETHSNHVGMKIGEAESLVDVVCGDILSHLLPAKPTKE